MPSIFLTPAAENDLINIWLYIARDNKEAADRVYLVAEKTFETLAASPQLGTLYQSKRARLKGMRSFPVGKFHSYLIYYQEQPKGIKIIRVLHTRMENHKRLVPENC